MLNNLTFDNIMQKILFGRVEPLELWDLIFLFTVVGDSMMIVRFKDVSNFSVIRFEYDE